MPHPCPVCENADTEKFLQLEQKSYWRCANCQARFLDINALPKPEEELQHYNQHRNIVGDPAYRNFLSRLTNPLLDLLKTKQNHELKGLDYGCGPGPALAQMIKDAGYDMALYDPHYYPDTAVLKQKYDFIACTEVAEHFHFPAREFEKLNALLKPGGILAIMTEFQSDDDKFEFWHYRRDPTHVTFYREATFKYIASKFGWAINFPARNVVLLEKQTA